MIPCCKKWRLKCLGSLFLLVLVMSMEAWADDATFEVKGYRVDGPAYFSEQQLAKILAPYTGEGRNFETLRAAQQALAAAYLEAGFGMVKASLPPQESHDGYITISVKPITLRNTTLKDNQFHDEFNILNALPSLQSGETVRPDMMARQLRLGNDNPSKQASVVLTAAEDNQVDADITVADKKPWKAFVTYDNTGTPETGPSRVSFGYQHSNLFDRDQVLTAQYTTSPNNYGGVRIWGLGYQIPIYSLAHDISIYAAYSDVSSGTISNLLNVSGKGYVFGARYQINFANRGFYKDKFAFGFEYRTVQPSLTFSGVELANPVDLHPVTLTYTGGYTESGKVDANFYLSAGRNIPGGRHGNDEDFALNRFRSQADYSVFRAGGSLTEVLPAGWYSRFTASAQYSRDLLVPAEQFGIGGADSVRGFLEREVTDDKGVQASAEVYTPDWYENHPGSIFSVRAVAFFDAGKVWRNEPLPKETPSELISSAGMGVRVSMGQYASLRLDYAHVLDGAQITHSGSDFLHALLVLMY